MGMNILECPECGHENKTNVKFCKKCGKNLKKNYIERFNSQINLLAVFAGLAISTLILILCSFLYGSVAVSGAIDLTIYIGLVLVTMVFVGGITTGIVVCRDFEDGMINGLFMSLIALTILGFILGIILLITMGIAASIASALKPFASSTASQTPSYLNTASNSNSNSLEPLYTFLKGIIIIILVFVAGALGGSFGVFLKNGIKKARNRGA
jgi:hypothetical protein